MERNMENDIETGIWASQCWRLSGFQCFSAWLVLAF